MESAEQVQEAEVAAVMVEPESKPERKESSLRQSLEKNTKELKDEDSGKPTNGTPETPAANKSFVNGENQQAPAEVVAVPKGIKPEELAIWNTLPVEAKKFLSRRGYETDATFNRRMAELVEREKGHSDIAAVITPEIREEFTRQGVAIPDLIRRSISWDKRVKEGIDGGLEFLEAHGYTAQDLVAHLTSGQAGQQKQPEYLTKEEALELAREEFKQQNELQQQSYLAEQNANALQSFLNSKPVFQGDPGTAAQFEEAVATEIEYLKFRGYQGSTSNLLEQSYERAIANNPAFSGLKSSPAPSPQETPNPKPENIYEQMERVRAAKAANKSASGSLGSGSPQYKSNSIRESLERNAVKFSS